jgi:hypothetical protein
MYAGATSSSVILPPSRFPQLSASHLNLRTRLLDEPAPPLDPPSPPCPNEKLTQTVKLGGEAVVPLQVRFSQQTIYVAAVYITTRLICGEGPTFHKTELVLKGLEKEV